VQRVLIFFTPSRINFSIYRQPSFSFIVCGSAPEQPAARLAVCPYVNVRRPVDIFRFDTGIPNEYAEVQGKHLGKGSKICRGSGEEFGLL
jgi:hypothetical protein